MTDCDVLVAGAGPTGLMLANWLTRLGVRVIVADGKEGPTRESRAIVVQARSLEIYDQLGIGDEVLGRAARAEALAPGFRDRVFARIPIGSLGGDTTPYPFLEMLEQSRNEEILYANLRALGGDVRWGAELTGPARTADGVEALVGGERIRARFCVGADGANSVVRRTLGIPFEGVTNDHLFYVIDANGVKGVAEDAVNVRPGGADFALAFPMPGAGNWRLIGLARDVDGDGTATEEEGVARLRDDFGITYETSRWFATYRVHHRVAARFREGPFFLAGDAGHVHSPVGGQGMNTGLQDAHNLAFKLADVVHGRAGDAWLDRYESERRPVARTLVRTTDRIFGFITSQRVGPRVLRRALIPLIGPLVARGARGGGGNRLFQYVSQTRIHYWMTPDGRPAADGHRDPVVGRRLRWTGDNFAVLRSLSWQIHRYGGAETVPAPALDLPVHVFAEANAFVPGRFYLVRPDGFVAAAAEAADATEIFRAALPSR